MGIDRFTFDATGVAAVMKGGTAAVQDKQRSGVVVGGGAIFEAVSNALAAGGVAVSWDLETVSAGADLAICVVEPRRLSSISAASAETFVDDLREDLKCAFRFLRRAAETIRLAASGGSVVVVAPPSSLQSAHDATRQGLRLLVKSAALELGPERIRVNIILPGSGDALLGRPCQPSDLAKAAAFLTSDASLFMTGADLVVDGGWLAR